MTTAQLLQQRLFNQCITHHPWRTPQQLVQHMGAIQAQDYLACLWAVALRVPGTTEAMAEKAIAQQKIVRSWCFRGTLHLVSPADIRWMLSLVSPRLQQKCGTYYRKLELDKNIFSRCHKILVKQLQDNRQLTREALKTALTAKGIATNDMRLNFILLHAALEQLICCGPRQGKSFTFVLLDEWVPAAKPLSEDEALAQLALRFFNSHGPASLADFANWSGLTIAAAKAGHSSIASRLSSALYNGTTYWMPATAGLAKTPARPLLLPGYDEYIVGYHDRSPTIAAHLPLKQIIGSNGLFYPVILHQGRVAGTWKRELTKTSTRITPHLFSPLKPAALEKAARAYGVFSGKPVELLPA